MVHVRTALCLVKSFHCTESKRGMHGLFYTHHRFGIFSLLPVTSSRLGCPHSHSMENVNNDSASDAVTSHTVRPHTPLGIENLLESREK